MPTKKQQKHEKETFAHTKLTNTKLYVQVEVNKFIQVSEWILASIQTQLFLKYSFG